MRGEQIGLFHQSVGLDLKRTVLLVCLIGLTFALLLFVSDSIIALVLVIGLLSREAIASVRPKGALVLTIIDAMMIPMVVLFTYHILAMLLL